MTIGRKSITTVITVNNNETAQKSSTSGQKPHEITIQTNKNYAICDMSPRIGEILSDFQGQQLISKDLHNGNLYLNDAVINKMESALNIALNPEKD